MKGLRRNEDATKHKSRYQNPFRSLNNNLIEMVEVFKTDVRKKTQSKMLLSILSEAFPLLKINFDLSDCDKVLRVEGNNPEAASIIILVKQNGFNCGILDLQ